jgi:hypothetical protein
MHPQLDVLERLRPPGGCLTAWQAGEMARHPEGLALSQRQHAADCARCAQLVADAQADLRAAAYERTPEAALAYLRDATAPRDFANLRWRLSAVAALALVVLVVNAPGGPRASTSDVHIKGGPELFATVLRADGHVRRDVALDELDGLSVGDRMMLDVRGAGTRWVSLHGFEDDAWQTLFEGPLPPDRRIPVAVRITPGSETRLRIGLCEAPGRGCRDHMYRF